MKIKNRQQFLIIATIAVVGLFIGERFVFEPLVGWWKTRAAKIVELRGQVANGNLMKQREPGIRNHWEQMRTNTLPNNTSLAEQQVLKEVANWSQDSGASINGITPQWKNDAEDYMTLNCRVEASGDIGTLSRLLYKIEADPLALRLESVELSVHDNSGQQMMLGLQISGLALLPPKKP